MRVLQTMMRRIWVNESEGLHSTFLTLKTDLAIGKLQEKLQESQATLWNFEGAQP